MKKLALLAALAGSLLAAPSAGAITFGTYDGNKHPEVGALFADYDPGSPGLDLLCSGTLISRYQFLTASHCTVFLPDVGVGPHDVYVSFDPSPLKADGTLDPATNLVRGTYHTHPGYGPGGGGDPHDIAVVTLDSRQSATPARLPTLNQLNQIDLKSKRFTAVGYGDRREAEVRRQQGPLLRRRAPLRHAELQHAHQGVAEARHEPVARRRRHVLRRLGRPALPRRRSERDEPARGAHGDRRFALPLDRRRLPGGHRLRARLPTAVRDIALAPLYPPHLDRARRGGSGALHLQSALAGLNSRSRGFGLGVSTPD